MLLPACIGLSRFFTKSPNLGLHHLRHLASNCRWWAKCCTNYIIEYSKHSGIFWPLFAVFSPSQPVAGFCPWRVPLSNWADHVATSVRSCSKISFCPFRTRVWRMARQVVCSERLGQTQTSELSAHELSHGMEDVYHFAHRTEKLPSRSIGWGPLVSFTDSFAQVIILWGIDDC